MGNEKFKSIVIFERAVAGLGALLVLFSMATGGLDGPPIGPKPYVFTLAAIAAFFISTFLFQRNVLWLGIFLIAQIGIIGGSAIGVFALGITLYLSWQVNGFESAIFIFSFFLGSIGIGALIAAIIFIMRANWIYLHIRKANPFDKKGRGVDE